MNAVQNAVKAAAAAREAAMVAETTVKVALSNLVPMFAETGKAEYDRAVSDGKSRAGKDADTERQIGKIKAMAADLLLAFPDRETFESRELKPLISAVLRQALPDTARKVLAIKSKDRTETHKRQAKAAQDVTAQWKRRIGLALFGKPEDDQLSALAKAIENAVKKASPEEPDGTLGHHDIQRAIAMINEAQGIVAIAILKAREAEAA